MRNEFNWNGEIYSAANSIQSCVGERLMETVRFFPDWSVLEIPLPKLIQNRAA